MDNYFSNKREIWNKRFTSDRDAGDFFPEENQPDSQKKGNHEKKGTQKWASKEENMSTLPATCASEGLALSTLALQDGSREQKGHMEMAKNKLNSNHSLHIVMLVAV